MSYESVEKDIAEGRLWRAKEVLQGRLASPDFDAELLRRYGEVLLLMGDKVEAGRYLFCSGSRDAEYAEAITLFLRRNPRGSHTQFLSSLPAMARRQGKLSPFLASTDFEKNGWTPESLRAVETRIIATGTPQQPISRVRHWITIVLQLIPIGLILLSLVVGFMTIMREVWSLLFG